MKKIVLHIGAGKCGSSALQAYLSQNPILKTSAGEVVFYGALGVDGKIITRGAVKYKANCSIFQYSSSVLLSNTDEQVFRENLENSLASIESDIIVLSCEGWLGQASLAREKLQCLVGYQTEVLMYVRPPVEWLNSAWWQWGAWNGVSFDQWYPSSIESTHWVSYVKQWREVNFVGKLIVRALPKDIIADFNQLLSISNSNSTGSRSNASLPGSVLRVFQQNQDLRPSAHDSRIDFSISRRLSKISSRPDWVISEQRIVDTIKTSESFTRELLQFMDLDQQKQVTNNKAWWDVAYYRNKEYQSPGHREISKAEKDGIMYHSILSLHEAESEIIRLKNRIRQLSRHAD